MRYLIQGIYSYKEHRKDHAMKMFLKRTTTLLLLLSMLIATLSCGGNVTDPTKEPADTKQNETKEATLKYGVFSANEFLYTDSDESLGKRDVSVLAAKNSVAAAQILCDSEKVSWKWTPDEESPLWEPEVNLLLSVYVDRNTAPIDSTMLIPQGTEANYVAHLAPFEVFDAMVPIESSTVRAVKGQKLGLYLRFPTDDAEAGIYRGTLSLESKNGEKADISVEVTVSSVSVPEKRTLKVTNWYNVPNMATYHDVELWSDAHWALIEQYGKLMYEMHQTHIWVPTNIIDAKEENGSYIFDFSKAERLIRLYLSLGMEYIEGAPFFTRDGWSNVEFQVKIADESVPLSSDKGMAYAEAFHTQWYTFLVENGWYDKTVQHVCDEPSAHCAQNYREAAALVRKWMPDVKIIEATELPDLDGALDVWVPKSLDYYKRRNIYDGKRGNTAQELWYYTCCFPGGKFLNRMLDMELIRTRYLHWANLIYDLDGYLHWGLNQYHHVTDNSVFSGACHPKRGINVILEGNLDNDALPAGDTHILYPMGEKVLRSVRSEMMRAGCEDYELLALLQQKDAEAAKKILSSCVKSFVIYEKDVEKFEASYKELLTTLEKFN